jgi:hypothetical protein
MAQSRSAALASGAPDSIMHPMAKQWLLALSLGVIALYVLFILVFFRESGPRDGDQFLVFHRLQYWNASLFGISKQWTPLMCSGLSLAGEPQVPFMSLSMAMSYLLGPLWGVRLATCIYLVAGWWGGFLYGGIWLRIRLQRTLAASLFIGNGFFFCRLAFGHFDFIPFLVLPLLLWALHRGVEWTQAPNIRGPVLRLGITALLMGGTVALVIDGSPVAIIHLLFWISVYAVTLAICTRSAIPVVLFGTAVTLALCLDAGYLWPMLQAQADFPRLTPDRFTSVLSLVWFALLPLRGKVLPANGNGHELSIFIGPALSYCVWQFRDRFSDHFPTAVARPLLVVSVVSIVLGMGSLKALHVPIWLSPFDLLRSLPGFRSIGVTGRYWGFLALPLSLMSTIALWKIATELRAGRRMHILLVSAVTFQLGFQAETLSTLWLHSPIVASASVATSFRRGPEAIDFVRIDDEHMQGEVLTPTRGVCNCYDMDDFTRAEAHEGRTLLIRALANGNLLAPQPSVHTEFITWSHIRLMSDCTSERSSACTQLPAGRIQWVLNQAYHRYWTAGGCATYASERENLIVDCPASRLRSAPIEIEFHDSLSELGAGVTLIAWKVWLCSLVVLFAAQFLPSNWIEARARLLTPRHRS